MDNIESQVSYAQAEQQWVCPECETINTGDSCKVCGCSRPQEKPAEKPVSNQQGNYTEDVSEWICPECETCNTGVVCAVCGHSRPNQKPTRKVPSKKIIIAAVVCAAILIGILFPFARYLIACSLLESGQYQQAYQAFSEMGEYLNSTSKSNQALCEWAKHLADDGRYEVAFEMYVQLPDGSPEKEKLTEECLNWARELNRSGEYVLSLKILDALPDSKVVSLLKRDVHYCYGLSLFKNERNYQEAYLHLKSVGTYSNAKKYIDELVSAWCKNLINSPVIINAKGFSNTVILTGKQQRELYLLLRKKPVYTYEPTAPYGTVSLSTNAHDFAVRKILLEMLPDNKYEDKEALEQLFTLFLTDHPEVFVRKHRDILDTLWDAPVVQNIIMNDSCFDDWLLGTWRTENKRYTLEFGADESDPDVIYSTIDLPWVSKPAGTAYWSINDMTFVWTDEEDHILAEVYRFKLLAPDKMEVYAFKDQKTYTMIRK